MAAAAGLRLERPMARIERSIARCDHIISDLLEYTRARELNRRPVALDPWLGEVLDEQHLPEGIVLERRFAASGTMVALDAERFRRVIINILDNAAQAVAAQQSAAGDRRITIATFAADQVEILVEDSGPGIAPEVLPRIFEPLFSTKSFGTGLGLPTVKQIVEQHGGIVCISSEPGAGTRVQLRLPTGDGTKAAA
jgi:signal transduction histidine kinase